jgi:hypothetical protein
VVDNAAPDSLRSFARVAAGVAAVLLVVVLLGAERVEDGGASVCVARLQKLRLARQALALNWRNDGTMPTIAPGLALRDTIARDCRARGWLAEEDLRCVAGPVYRVNSLLRDSEPVFAGCVHGDLCWNQEIRVAR